MELKTKLTSGFEPALYGMRNPLNSWHLSDSITNNDFILGEKDLNLAQRLINAGTEHCKFMRQIQVWVDISAPRYWWSEFDTYKIGTSANSTSTMHKLFDKKSVVTIDMFEVHTIRESSFISFAIEELNKLRSEYFESTTQEEKNLILTTAKRILPESYINTRTVNINYAVIRHIVLQRRNHRLKYEWQDCFCKWATTLPYAKELIFCGYEDEYERLK